MNIERKLELMRKKHGAIVYNPDKYVFEYTLPPKAREKKCFAGRVIPPLIQITGRTILVVPD